jgi:hypothetical protein
MGCFQPPEQQSNPEAERRRREESSASFCGGFASARGTHGSFSPADRPSAFLPMSISLSRLASGVCPPAMKPNPPPRVTLAARAPPAAPAMGAHTTGTRTLSSCERRVVMGIVASWWEGGREGGERRRSRGHRPCRRSESSLLARWAIPSIVLLNSSLWCTPIQGRVQTMPSPSTVASPRSLILDPLLSSHPTPRSLA